MNNKLKIRTVTLLFVIIIFSGCSPNKKCDIEIKMKNFVLLYHQSLVPIEFDSTSLISTSINYSVGVLFINKTGKPLTITLNNLRTAINGSSIFLKNKELCLKFYNYSFSKKSYEHVNRFIINSNDSEYVQFESPFYYIDKNFSLKIIDSLKNNLNQMVLNLGIDQNEADILNYCFDKNKVVLVTEPIPNFSFSSQSH